MTGVRVLIIMWLLKRIGSDAIPRCCWLFAGDVPVAVRRWPVSVHVCVLLSAGGSLCPAPFWNFHPACSLPPTIPLINHQSSTSTHFHHHHRVHSAARSTSLVTRSVHSLRFSITRQAAEAWQTPPQVMPAGPVMLPNPSEPNTIKH